jgi:hypothetical protein
MSPYITSRRAGIARILRRTTTILSIGSVILLVLKRGKSLKMLRTGCSLERKEPQYF